MFHMGQTCNVALQFETENVGETYTLVAHESGYGAELAGTLQVIRCRVHDDEQPNLQAEFDFQVHTHAEDASRTAFLRAVKVESLPLNHPVSVSPITISTVRDWPLARWEAAARGVVSSSADPEATVEFEKQSQKAHRRTTPITREEQRRMTADAILSALYPEIERSGDTPGERRRWNGLRKLAEVAVIYRELVKEGRSDPATELARIKKTTPTTARSWIHRARQAGLLGPAVGRTAGEAPDLERARQVALAAQDALRNVEIERDVVLDALRAIRGDENASAAGREAAASAVRAVDELSQQRDAAVRALVLAERSLAAINAKEQGD